MGVTSIVTPRFQCPRGYTHGHPDCSGVSLQADSVHAAAVEYIRAVVHTPEFQALSRGEIDELLAEDNRYTEVRLEEIDKQVHDLDGQLDWLIHQAAKNPQIRPSFDKKIATYTEQMSVVQRDGEQLRRQREQRKTRTRDAHKVCELLKSFDPVWETVAHDERREVAALLLETATATGGEGEVILQLKAHFLPLQEVRIPALHWGKRPTMGPLSLTPRQCEAIYLRSQGLTNEQIAQRWDTKASTPGVHVTNALRKLQVATVEDAMEMAGEHITRIATSVPEDRRTGGLRPTPGLTARETELLPVIADLSRTYRDIAAEQSVTYHTIRIHAANIMRKLSVEGRADIAESARCAGIVTPQSSDEDANLVG